MYHQAGVPVLPDIGGTTGDAGPRGVGAPDPKGDYTCTQQHDAGSYRRASERSRRSSPRPHSRSAGSRWPRWPRQHQCRVRRPVRPRSTASARRPSHSPSTGRAARSRHRPTSSSSWTSRAASTPPSSASSRPSRTAWSRLSPRTDSSPTEGVSAWSASPTVRRRSSGCPPARRTSRTRSRGTRSSPVRPASRVGSIRRARCSGLMTRPATSSSSSSPMVSPRSTPDPPPLRQPTSKARPRSSRSASETASTSPRSRRSPAAREAPTPSR